MTDPKPIQVTITLDEMNEHIKAALERLVAAERLIQWFTSAVLPVCPFKDFGKMGEYGEELYQRWWDRLPAKAQAEFRGDNEDE